MPASALLLEKKRGHSGKPAAMLAHPDVASGASAVAPALVPLGYFPFS